MLEPWDDRDSLPVVSYAPDICENCGAQNYGVEEFHGVLLCPDCQADEYDYESWGDDYGYDYDDEIHFADPGGRSALRASSPSNPRNLPCPTCYTPNVLTPADRARGYQCDGCADRAEGRYMGGDY